MAMVVLVLIVLDVVGTLILATAVSGRSRSSTFFPGDWDLSGAAGRIYNRFRLVAAPACSGDLLCLCLILTLDLQ